MTRLVILLAEIWRYRMRLLLPTILFPVLAVAWSMGNPPVFEATTTLSLDKEKVRSPLLQNIDTPENAAILERFVESENVLLDTLYQTGGLLDGANSEKENAAVADMASRLELKVLSSDRIQLNYTDTNPSAVVKTLEQLSLNFIHEILAPERLRLEQVLFSLSEQVRYYAELERLNAVAYQKAQEATDAGLMDAEHLREVVRLEFEQQRAASQRDLAQQEYDVLLAKSKALITSMNEADANSVLWFVEAPVRIGGDKDVAYHIVLAQLMALLGLVFGVLWVFYSKMMDSTLRRDDDIYDLLGLKILGRVPNLGPVQVQDGRLNVRL